VDAEEDGDAGGAANNTHAATHTGIYNSGMLVQLPRSESVPRKHLPNVSANVWTRKARPNERRMTSKSPLYVATHAEIGCMCGLFIIGLC
jgi:hypothetical protein